MADPALQVTRDTPDFKVLVDGGELAPEIALDILDVEVCHHLDGPDSFAVTFTIWDSDRQELKHFDDGPLAPGAKVEIRAGYADRLSSLIEGEVTALEPEFPDTAAPTLRLVGYDSLHRLRRGRRTRTFLAMKDSEIAQKVARELGLGARVDDSGVTHEYVLQNNRSDIDFLLERARRIRYELTVRDGTLFFRKAANDQSPVMTLLYGQTLRSFHPRLSTLGQLSEVVVQGWDVKTKEPLEGRATAGAERARMGGKLGTATSESAFFSTVGPVVDKPVASAGEAEQIAKARFEDLSMRFLTGEGLAIGEASIRAGDVVELQGLGRRFSGRYYVVRSEHRVNAQEGYTTRFSVERNAT